MRSIHLRPGSARASHALLLALLALAAGAPACGSDDPADASAASSDGATTSTSGGQGGAGGGATTGTGGAAATTGVGGSGGSACTPGETQACYSGPPGTEGVGPCVSGTQTCLPDGSGFDPCAGEVGPSAETCGNDIDEDCNGADAVCGAAGAAVWAKSFGDAVDQRVMSVDVDSAGDVVLVGRFAGTVDFGGGAITAAATNDMFVLKLDPNGNFLFVKTFGTSGTVTVQDVIVNANDDIFVTGRLQGVMDLGGGALSSVSGAEDIFLAKFTSDGSYVFGKLFGDAADQSGTALATSGADIFLAGRIAGSADFGGGVLTSAGGRDIFVARFDGNGGHIGTKLLGGVGDDTVIDIAVGPTGDIAIAGGFNGAVDFGGGALTSLGLSDAFVAQYDNNGGFLWAQRYGDALDQFATGVDIDAGGDLAVLVEAEGVVDLGGGNLTSAGQDDLLLAKLDGTGAHLWSQRVGNPQGQQGRFARFDGGGNIAFCGLTSGPTDFGAGPLSGGGASEVFYAKVDPTGALVYAYVVGDAATQSCAGMTVDPAGNGYVVGRFAGTLDFGGGISITSAGVDDAFVARVAP